MGLAFDVRAGLESDWAFCADAWVQSLRAASREARAVPKELFFPHWHQRVAALLASRQVRVAGPPGDTDTIYGFLVVGPRPDAVEFCYVKSAFRRLGIAKALLGDMLQKPVLCTHWTRELGEWILPRYPGLTFHPYLSETIDGERNEAG